LRARRRIERKNQCNLLLILFKHAVMEEYLCKSIQAEHSQTPHSA
jgi:hypothetical protein